MPLKNGPTSGPNALTVVFESDIKAMALGGWLVDVYYTVVINESERMWLGRIFPSLRQ